MRRAALLAVLALTLAASPAAGAPAVPSKPGIESAKRYMRDREGINAFSVVDSRGRLRGLAQERVYASASVVKAMLLVAYLRKVGRRRLPGAEERSLLSPMITRSNNRAATAIYSRLGDAALYDLARRAGMRRFSIALRWSSAQVSSADQARFMARFDRLTPRRTRDYARSLMSSIVPWQRWGFSRFSLAAGWKTFFKGGWIVTPQGHLVHEVALFQRGRTRFSLAVLTDGNPSRAYGTATLRGVAARLFR